MAPTRPRAEVHIQVGFLLGRVVSPPRDYGAASEQGALLGKPCPHGAARSRAHPSQGASWARAPVSGQQADILTRQARPPHPLPRVLGRVPLPGSQREPSDSHLPRLSHESPAQPHAGCHGPFRRRHAPSRDRRPVLLRGRAGDPVVPSQPPVPWAVSTQLTPVRRAWNEGVRVWAGGQWIASINRNRDFSSAQWGPSRRQLHRTTNDTGPVI